MDLHVTATLNSGTGLSDDRFVNNFAVADSAGPMNDVADFIAGFYNTLFGGLGALVPMNSFLSGIIDNTAGKGLTVRVYDVTGALDGSPHGSPDYEESYTVPAPAAPGADLPSEVAACITLEAIGRSTALVEVPDGADPDAKRDRPKQRRTGRIYFGPLNSNATELVGGIVRVSNSFRDTARLAIEGLNSNLEGMAGGGDLAIWSRTDAVMRDIEAVSVDNAVDIIRSRGEKPSLRERTVIFP